MGDTVATREAYVQVKDLKKHYGDGDARLTVLDGIDKNSPDWGVKYRGACCWWGLRVRASRRFLT